MAHHNYTDEMNAPTASSVDQGATVVITHRVRAGKHAEYEAWLAEIAPLCNAAPGHLDWHIVRPIPGLTGTYTVIIRFDTAANLAQWMNSPARARLIEKVKPLFVTGDDFSSAADSISGLLRLERRLRFLRDGSSTS
jgi:uncharacterized protein